MLIRFSISRLLTSSDRFDELSMQRFLSADKDFLYCLTEGCSSGQIHDNGVEGPIFRCAACGHRMCTAHNPVVPFHENETCTQYNERIKHGTAEREAQEKESRLRGEQEEASAAEVSKSSVECPGCGVHIQKLSGCDHMTCKRVSRPFLFFKINANLQGRRVGCGFQFCYICRAPYNGTQGINSIGNVLDKRVSQTSE